MTDEKLIEKLARAACVAEGSDPDKRPAADEPALLVMYEAQARRFLAMQRAYEEAREESENLAAITQVTGF